MVNTPLFRTFFPVKTYIISFLSFRARSSGFWAASLKRPINRWAAVWRKSRLKLIENKKTDLLWLIIHCTSKVPYALKTCAYKIKSEKCALCSQDKTIEHCFLFALAYALFGIILRPICPVFLIPLFLFTLPLFSSLSCLAPLCLLSCSTVP